MKRLLADESGQGLVEYALILALVAVALVFALSDFGGAVSSLMQDSVGKMP